ncbi:GTP-binding protein Rhes-like, partial [Convolutriloba macropyga]|uniref:GTP-binding protein Rhes-like n=1 Tax=Convolutriloba macropyga TaxID=536237 RepID=UPI003F51BC32
AGGGGGGSSGANSSGGGGGGGVSYEVYEVIDLANAELDIPPKNCYRLVVLGSSGVGKTAITQRFLHNRYVDQYFPTIEDFHRKIYKIGGVGYRLDILDTSGNRPFQAMRRVLFLSGDIFLLVYAIDNIDSFKEVQRLRDAIIETKQITYKTGKIIVPMVVAGNKSDLEEDREILEEEISTWISGLKRCAYVETSAKTGRNIDVLFSTLFETANLPVEMSLEGHKFGMSSGDKPEDHSLLGAIMKKDSEAKGAIAVHARRPSLRSDLGDLKTRAVVEKQRVKEFESSSAQKLKEMCSIS